MVTLALYARLEAKPGKEKGVENFLREGLSIVQGEPATVAWSIRRSPWAAAFLDGVNAASLGLMAAVSWQLGRASLVDVPTVILAVAAFAILMRTKVNSAWLVLAGGVIGLAAMLLGGH